MKRACVFVDGENFRHSLKDLFQNGRYTFGRGDYLPQAKWHEFFAAIAGRFDCELLRTLTTDLITFSSMFDVAIILSGDADYLPPVAAIKMKGKLVYSVSFLDEKGRQLPGGARRLSNAVDSRADLDFETVRQALDIQPIGIGRRAARAA